MSLKCLCLSFSCLRCCPWQGGFQILCAPSPVLFSFLLSLHLLYHLPLCLKDQAILVRILHSLFFLSLFLSLSTSLSLSFWLSVYSLLACLHFHNHSHLEQGRYVRYIFIDISTVFFNLGFIIIKRKKRFQFFIRRFNIKLKTQEFLKP